MSRPPRLRERVSTAGVVLACLGSLCGASWAGPTATSDRVLAVIDGVDVTTVDADDLRAILQPPPTREQAKRLAVDAALAWWDMHGWLAGSSAQGRLDAWRSWLVAGEDLADGSVVAAVEKLGRQLQEGVYGSARAERALELNRRSGRLARAVRLRWIRIDWNGRSESREVSLPLRAVDPGLATAIGRMDVGEVSGPILVRSGMYWVRRVPDEQGAH